MAKAKNIAVCGVNSCNSTAKTEVAKSVRSVRCCKKDGAPTANKSIVQAVIVLSLVAPICVETSTRFNIQNMLMSPIKSALPCSSLLAAVYSA
ncbi:MAG: hypothetical protein J1D88_03225 [Treponema sp.]|nr:hypothetical protein [Treponema sp.]